MGKPKETLIREGAVNSPAATGDPWLPEPTERRHQLFN